MAHPVVTPIVAPVAPVVAPVASSKLSAARDLFGRGYTQLNNLESNLGKGMAIELKQQDVLIGPVAQGESNLIELTTMEKAGNIVKTVFNRIDAAGAAISRGIFGVTEQVFGRSQVLVNSNVIVHAGTDAKGRDTFVDGNGQIVNPKGFGPAGKLLADIAAQGGISAAGGTYALNAKNEVVIAATGERVDVNGAVVKDGRIVNLVGRIANVIAHVASVAVRITAVVVGAIAALATTLGGIVFGAPIALIVGAVKALQNRAAANAAEKADEQFHAMKAQTILINMATHASATEAELRASLNFINQFCPAVFDAHGKETTSNIAEVTAKQARSVLTAKLDAIKANYDASLIGKASNFVQAGASKVANVVKGTGSLIGAGLSKATGVVKGTGGLIGTGLSKATDAARTVASTANNHRVATAGLLLAGTAATGYMFPGMVPSVFGPSAAEKAAEEAARYTFGGLVKGAAAVAGTIIASALGIAAVVRKCRSAAPERDEENPNKSNSGNGQGIITRPFFDGSENAPIFQGSGIDSAFQGLGNFSSNQGSVVDPFAQGSVSTPVVDPFAQGSVSTPVITGSVVDPLAQGSVVDPNASVLGANLLDGVNIPATLAAHHAQGQNT